MVMQKQKGSSLMVPRQLTWAEPLIVNFSKYSLTDLLSSLENNFVFIYLEEDEESSVKPLSMTHDHLPKLLHSLLCATDAVIPLFKGGWDHSSKTIWKHVCDSEYTLQACASTCIYPSIMKIHWGLLYSHLLCYFCPIWLHSKFNQHLSTVFNCSFST